MVCTYLVTPTCLGYEYKIRQKMQHTASSVVQSTGRDNYLFQENDHKEGRQPEIGKIRVRDPGVNVLRLRRSDCSSIIAIVPTVIVEECRPHRPLQAINPVLIGGHSSLFH